MTSCNLAVFSSVHLTFMLSEEIIYKKSGVTIKKARLVANNHEKRTDLFHFCKEPWSDHTIIHNGLEHKINNYESKTLPTQIFTRVPNGGWILMTIST